VIAALQMVTSGVIAEMLSRVYLEANGALAYVARPRPELSANEGDGWHWPSAPEAARKSSRRK